MVRIFTNSVSDLSPRLAEEFGVRLIPDNIIFGTQQYLNNVDINPQTMYQKLAVTDKLPTTAHPNIYQYLECFRQETECSDIVCVNLTSKMSGSYSTACIARDMLNADPTFAPRVHTFDSLQVSFGLTVMVLAAARMAAAGADAEAILSMLEGMRSHIGVYFVMESLQNAKKGGRVGAIRVLAADLLGVRPILQFSDGLVRDIRIVRKLTDGYDDLIERYRTRAKRGGEVFVFHADREQTARRMAGILAQIDPAATIRVEWVGAVIGIYTGAGCLGLAFLEE